MFLLLSHIFPICLVVEVINLFVNKKISLEGFFFFFFYSTGNTSEVLQVCHLHSVRLFKIIGHLRGGTVSALNTDIQWVKPISPGFWSASVWQSASTDRQWLALIFNLKVLFQALAGGWLPLPCSDIHLSDLNGKTRAPSGPAWRAVWILGVPHWIQPHANAKPFSRLNKDKANDSLRKFTLLSSAQAATTMRRNASVFGNPTETKFVLIIW